MSAKWIVGGMVLAGLWLGAVVGTAIAEAEEGKTTFEKKCITCHSLGDQKGKMAQFGGALDGVGSKRDADWLRAYLADPKSQIPEAKMPKQKLTDEELEGLVEYMVSQK